MDFEYLGLRGFNAGNFPFPSPLPGGAVGPPTAFFNTATSVSADWLFTARPRVGWAMREWLLYVTGGLAVGRENFRNIGAVYGNLGLCDDPRWLDRRRRYRIRNRTQLIDPRRVSPCRPRHGEYGGNAHAALSGAHPYGLGSLDDRDCARRTQLSLLSLSPRAPIALMSAPTLRGSAIPGELQACERKPAASRARGWGDLRFATIRRYSAKLRIADLRLRTAFGVNTGTAFGASQCSA